MRKKNENLYRKLVASIKLQLEERDIVANKNRVRPWKSDNVGRNQIYEFKSSAGLGFRLFFFIHEEEVVICTHGWEKDNEKSKTKQDQQFSRAEKYRFLFEQ
jgi:putative component of toxin-antitoxin plasmid stabilization module